MTRGNKDNALAGRAGIACNVERSRTSSLPACELQGLRLDWQGGRGR